MVDAVQNCIDSAPASPDVVAQSSSHAEDKSFEPHVLGTAGSAVEFPNRDPFFLMFFVI